MSRGKISSSINDAEKFLRSIGLLELPLNSPKGGYEKFDRTKCTDYKKEYEYFNEQRMYDFKLTDSSLFQFKYFGDDDISYCYMEHPAQVPTFEEYLMEMYGATLEEGDDDSTRADYESHLASLPVKLGTTPIRFDYSPNQYQEGHHPSAHLHMGYRSQVRLRVNTILTPFAFVLLVCRQCYPGRWLKAFENHEDTMKHHVRKGLREIEKHHFSGLDEHEFRLE